MTVEKDREFGPAGGQGNRGEDAKDYWWYLDGVAQLTYRTPVTPGS